MNAEFFIEGKRYISAKRAAKLIGYAPDYVGQLARTGKVDSKMIGRSWYVCEESILGYRKETLDGGTPKKNPSKISAEIVVQPATDFGAVETPSETVTEVPATSVTEIATEATETIEAPVMADEAKAFGPVVPSISWTGPDADLEIVEGSAPTPVPAMPSVTVHASKASGSRHFFLGAASALAVIATVVSSIGFAASEWKADTVAIQASIRGDRESISAMMTDYVGVGAAAVAESLSGSARKDGFFSVVAAGFKAVIAKIFGGERSPKRVDIVKLEADAASAAGADGQDGLVIVPSTGSTSTDAELREYIKNSFSDEVEVVESNEDGTGVIRPVFRDRKGEDYMYVLVPVPAGKN